MVPYQLSRHNTNSQSHSKLKLKNMYFSIPIMQIGMYKKFENFEKLFSGAKFFTKIFYCNFLLLYCFLTWADPYRAPKYVMD